MQHLPWRRLEFLEEQVGDTLAMLASVIHAAACMKCVHAYILCTSDGRARQFNQAIRFAIENSRPGRGWILGQHWPFLLDPLG